MIPHIIHQIYPGVLPSELRQNVENLKNLNPGWEHRLYDDEACAQIVSEYDSEIAQAYNRIDVRYGAARADFLRQLIIYRYGGVYCDIKSGFSRPLDQVILPDDRYILSQWSDTPGHPQEGRHHRDLAHIPGGEFVTYFIIAEPAHPFTAAAIQCIVDNIASYRPWSAVGRNGVLRTTGPIAYTLALHPILAEHSHRFATDDELGSFYSLTNGYNHSAVFTSHYSQLKIPVVRLGVAASALSRFFFGIRTLRRALFFDVNAAELGR